MGNVVTGEALRLLGTNDDVNTYIAMQAAVPSHAYDPNATDRSIPILEDDATPDVYANYYTNGASCYFNGIVGVGTYVNFFNTNDFALNVWTTDQNTKPDTASGYSYDPDSGDFFQSYTLTQLFFLNDTYTIFSRIIEARCFAVGAQASVAGPFSGNQLELDIAPYDFGSQHLFHSGEFRSDYAHRWQFWDSVLANFGITR